MVLFETKPKGFTLIELLVVISIIALLASIVLVSVTSTRRNARESGRISSLDQLQKALELYYLDHQSYPSTVGRSGCTVLTGFNGWTPADNVGHCGEATAAGSFGYDATGYIPDLVPTYLPQLPTDPLKNQKIPTNGCRLVRGITGYSYGSDGKKYLLYSSCGAETPNAKASPIYDGANGFYIIGP